MMVTYVARIVIRAMGLWFMLEANYSDTGAMLTLIKSWHLQGDRCNRIARKFDYSWAGQL